ncbi:MAG: hypothetical protein SP4CHLAM5_09360 [Chlamydiia bacterium]|nr:hypothetical protein [Chlamydiia bacterium]MCH9618795.1 hypothetical protein [Chlamydiia bacterium]MCH9624612.1 hypothetical protein [Chlamydiia bacterium]
MNDTLFFTIFLIVSLLFQGFFTMTEMSFVSFNRVRLAYFVEKGEKGAASLLGLLDKPTALFGTTLIGVNFFLQLGSECSRRVFLSLGLDPDYSYIPQIILVLLFAELIPMLAARDHSEHLAMFAIRPIHLLSRLFSPLIYIIDGLSKVVSYFLKGPLKMNSALSRDELKNLLMDSEGSPKESEKEDLEPLIENIFSLKAKSPQDLMIPIDKMDCASYHSVVGDIRKHLQKGGAKYIPLYHEKRENIFGIAYSQDLLNLSDSSLVKDIARSPWFVTSTNTIFQVINQFRKNNQKLAIVLDVDGAVIGVLTLSSLVEEIFSGILLNHRSHGKNIEIYIDKAFAVNTKLSEALKSFKINPPPEKDSTLEEIMTKKLGAPPKDKDTAYTDDYQLIFEGASYSAEKKIRVKSRS